jgi:DMSO reductase anchor subunit
LGKVRVLDPPHTQPNFVMREMGYRVARKHVQLLRKATLLLGFGLPIVFLLVSQGGLAVTGALLAILSMAAGLLIERWLFFAEAEHVSMLYYGADAA